MSSAVYINKFSVACALGESNDLVRRNLLSKTPTTVAGLVSSLDGRAVPFGKLPFELSGSGGGARSRTNRLADHCLRPLAPAIAEYISKVGAQQIAVVVGTSTSGISEAEDALKTRLQTGQWPASYHLMTQELGDTAAHVAQRAGAGGPVYGISTACTSGAKAIASAARLIKAGFCKAAIAGGVDTFCNLTLNGFAALESLSDRVCNPFSRNRRGINIGEGGALFLLSSEPSTIRLAGWGESADAYHISAPDPKGVGAEDAMRLALTSAKISASEIGYLNLHGTATKLNDSMEARAASRVFGAKLACSSTKPMTGHMLGAAGACEAAFAIMALEDQMLPAHLWDGERDVELPPLRFAEAGETAQARLAMSCSYAFGGNNIALVLARA